MTNASDPSKQPVIPSVRESWGWDEGTLRQHQLAAFNQQLQAILPTNEFYRSKLGGDCCGLDSLDQLNTLPFTTKDELVASANTSPLGISAHHTWQRSAYSRTHRTSGTTGKPLMLLDSASDWNCWSLVWQHVLEAAGIGPDDRVFLAFSFGPFIGFWSAHQACIDRGSLVIPGGGLSSLARLEFMKQSEATALFCTPSYALHLSEVAEAEKFPLRKLPVQTIVVAGESGGSIPSVREKIESAWDAQLVDHSGATEIGPWGFGWPDRPGLHINEASFIAELIPIEGLQTGAEDDEDAMHELVLTSLSRWGAPVIRYRTGDAVIAERPSDGPCRFLWLPKGVVGRTDNMVTIRGVNVFPSSIDAIVRSFDEVGEYQVLVTRKGELDQLEIKLEAPAATVEMVAKALSVRLGLRVPVATVDDGSLPRSEGKSRRWNDLR